MTNEKGANPKAGAPCDCLPGERKGFDTRFTPDTQRQASRYPGTPGAKGQDSTSQKAAAAMATRAPCLRLLAMRTLARLEVATPLEVVAAAKVTREALQPRLSELRAIGLVEATGARRQNPSGKWAAVLQLSAEGRKMLAQGAAL
jgi:hypothetical protein